MIVKSGLDIVKRTLNNVIGEITRVLRLEMKDVGSQIIIDLVFVRNFNRLQEVLDMKIKKDQIQR